MKILLTICVAMTMMLAACQSNNDNEDTGIVGQWKLIKQESTGLRPTAEAPLPDYEEFFEFKTDGTFQMTRSNGWQESGTYTWNVIDGKSQVVAKFSNDQINISCSPGETYLNTWDTKFLRIEGAACDAANLYYSKVSGNE